MTAKDKNKQTMGNSVTQTLENNKPEWAAKPVFADSVTTHENNMGAIQSWSEKQQQTLEYKGLVRDKNLLKLIMVDMLVREISAIKAYSVKTGNSQLASSVNYSKSKLNKMSDAQFLAAATIVNDTAIANADALKDFGITDEMTTTMKGDLTAFNSIMKKPKALLSQLKMFTSNLATSVQTMMNFLSDSLDNQVKSQFFGTDFAKAYTNSRKIYKTDKNTNLIGKVTAEDTGRKLKDVIIEMVDYPVAGDTTIRSTNSLGNYAFMKLDCTKATIRVRCIGYATAEYEINLVKSETKDFDIKLVPVVVPVNA